MSKTAIKEKNLKNEKYRIQDILAQIIYIVIIGIYNIFLKSIWTGKFYKDESIFSDQDLNFSIGILVFEVL